MNETATKSAVCLGCGCLCDDIEVMIERDRISQTVNTCALGETWFGDGTLPAEIRVNAAPASFELALGAITSLLRDLAGRLLIYVADDLSCNAHRAAIALADRLGASIDGLTADTVADGLLAAQRRGRATGTLGELRHRADLVVLWGVNPLDRYPRFIERLVAASSLHASNRRLIAVDIGDRLGPAECSERITLSPDDEIDALSVMRAAINGRPLTNLPPSLSIAVELAKQLAESKYAGLVFDAEPTTSAVDPALPEALIALTQSLNGPTRAALWALRAGGNRNGFESVITWQTGYPLSVDFSHGYPKYVANENITQRLHRQRFTAALVLGDPRSIPSSVAQALSTIESAVVGPRASQAQFSPNASIDTGSAAIHEDALVLRMDDVPIHASKLLDHPHSVEQVLDALTEQLFPLILGVKA